MKTSNKIIIIVLVSMLSLLLFIFSKSKYYQEHEPHDYNSKKYNLQNISTIVLDNQMSCFVKSGESTVVDFRYWGKDENLPNKLCVKNDTLYLNHQFKNSTSSIHITCKNLTKIIARNKSLLTIINYESKLLNVIALNYSHISINHREENDSIKKTLNFNLVLMGQSTLSIHNSSLNQVNVLAINSQINFYKSKLQHTSIDLKSGAEFNDRDTKYLQSIKLKSDNRSTYLIQYDRK